MTRHSGSANPCPVIDFDAGFNAWMAYAFGLPKGVTVEQKFGKPFGMSWSVLRFCFLGSAFGTSLACSTGHGLHCCTQGTVLLAAMVLIA